jgi:CHAT domain-containing protein/tetratricopeptide (TPR) repeat protein
MSVPGKSANRSAGLAATIALMLVAAAGAAAADEPPKVDAGTLDRALALAESRKFLEAEKPLHDALASIDAGRLPASDLGRCLSAIEEVNRELGRKNDDALKVALRYRKFVSEKLADDPATRNRVLEQNSADLADILLSMDRAADAQKYLAAALAAAEKRTDADPFHTLSLLVKTAQLYQSQDDPVRAKQYGNRVIDLALATSKRIDKGQIPAARLAECTSALAAGCVAVDDKPQAIAAYRRLCGLQADKHDVNGTIETRMLLGSLLAQSNQFDDAIREYQAALSDQRQLNEDSPTEARILSLTAAVYSAQGVSAEARRAWEAAAVIYTKAINRLAQSSDSPMEMAAVLNQLQIVSGQAGHYQDAVDSARRLLEIRQKTLGEEHPSTIAVKSDLGALYGAAQLYESAAPLLRDAAAYWQKRNPPAPLQLARALNDLAVVERGIGSLGEAQSLLERALELRKAALPADDPRLAQTLANLASVFLGQGNFARAQLLFDEAIDIYRGRGAGCQEALAGALLNEAMVFKSQGQLPRAIDDCREALDIYQRAFGAEAPGAIAYYNALASLSTAQGKLTAAAQYNSQAWQLCQRHHLDQEPVAATTLHQKATIGYLRDQFATAMADWEAALKIQEAAGQTAQAARTLNYMAKIASFRGRQTDAEAFYRHALQLQGTSHAYPAVYYLTSCNLAEILHDQGKADEAIGLVRDAAKFIETPRAGTIGGESQRAEYFAQFANAFDLLVTWNLEAGRVADAFAFAERGRNRTFLDELSLAGVDLRDTLTGPEGEKLRSRERQLRAKLGTLEAQAQELDSSVRAVKSANAAVKERADLFELSRQLDATQDEYAKIWSEIRSASPYYRQQLSGEAGKLGSLDALREELRKLHSLMLFYYVGAKKSFLLVIDPDEKDVSVVPLEAPASLADSMSIKPGPVTRAALVQLVSQYLADVRDRAGGRGLAGVVHSEKGVAAAEQGTSLADVLVPRSVRSIVEHRAPQSVIIVPDGALHELPFEALLLESQPAPKYLLDVFPPIAYAPSANILMNLAQRPSATGGLMVLTVGNPAYPQAATSAQANEAKAARDERSLAAVSRAAYIGLGGRLPPLPATAKECQRVAKAFASAKVIDLEAEKATEQNVRKAIAGCRFIHLAAHGLVDQQHDNLFGAIALTPPAQAINSSDNDGFLSLHEIHSLPLSACQLAVLSACQTNVGPDRPMEAGSTIAQAFLAAGARRAICSHWNVDDASTAELIGGFFERVAAATAIDYSKSLHDARVAIRSQSQWTSPYYWAPFILIGPPR